MPEKIGALFAILLPALYFSLDMLYRGQHYLKSDEFLRGTFLAVYFAILVTMSFMLPLQMLVVLGLWVSFASTIGMAYYLWLAILHEGVATEVRIKKIQEKLGISEDEIQGEISREFVEKYPFLKKDMRI